MSKFLFRRTPGFHVLFASNPRTAHSTKTGIGRMPLTQWFKAVRDTPSF
jgi:hypothetical protein